MSDLKNYLIISKDDNKILNVVLWDGITSYSPPENTYLELQTNSYTQIRNAILIDGIWTPTNLEEEWL